MFVRKCGTAVDREFALHGCSTLGEFHVAGSHVGEDADVACRELVRPRSARLVPNVQDAALRQPGGACERVGPRAPRDALRSSAPAGPPPQEACRSPGGSPRHFPQRHARGRSPGCSCPPGPCCCAAHGSAAVALAGCPSSTWPQHLVASIIIQTAGDRLLRFRPYLAWIWPNLSASGRTRPSSDQISPVRIRTSKEIGSAAKARVGQMEERPNPSRERPWSGEQTAKCHL